jgi:hypothetical protein
MTSREKEAAPLQIQARGAPLQTVYYEDLFMKNVTSK